MAFTNWPPSPTRALDNISLCFSKDAARESVSPLWQRNRDDENILLLLEYVLFLITVSVLCIYLILLSVFFLVLSSHACVWGIVLLWGYLGQFLGFLRYYWGNV